MRKENGAGVEPPEFEAFLEGDVEAPPEEVVYQVTPWRTAVNQILAGMALTAITLNFLNLNFILPTIGLLLSLLGYRALRRENSWLRACWVLTVVKLALSIPDLVLNATIFRSFLRATPLSTVWLTVGIAATFLLLFCLWRGFLTMQRKIGLPEHARAIFALLVWYVLMVVLTLLHAEGWIIFIPMAVFYILDLRGLYRLSRELEDGGYELRPRPPRVSDRALVIAILAALTIGIGSGYLFGQGYRMDWSELRREGAADVERIKSELSALDFPEDVLADLTDEDVRSCDGAIRVIVDFNDHAMNDGILKTTRSGNRISTTREYPVKELRITSVGVELPGEQERWKIFHHFRWTENPLFYGTESIELMPADENSSGGWVKTGELSGQVLYDNRSKTYAAPYFFLGEETYAATVVFFGESSYTRPFAAFSFPKSGENLRGYISYTIVEMRDGYIVDAWINYTHQRSWLQYPVQTALEYRMSGGWGQSIAFKTVQDALQFYPNAEDFLTFSQQDADLK